MYKKCLDEAQKRFNDNNLKLCPRGYCTAKNKFEVYPSAYANGYAVKVCKGIQKDFLGEKYPDTKYIEKLNNGNNESNSLKRWYNEEWVNVCEKGNGPGGYKVCGSGNGINDLEKYPYCRAYYKLTGTTVTTAQELTKDEIDILCKEKKSKKQGINGKPTRVSLKKTLKHNNYAGGYNETKITKIPKNVRDEAILGLELIKNGFLGGTQTGWDRGDQLANDKHIDSKSLADMRTWFARHGPDSVNGGTSYSGYCKWVEDGKPMDKNKTIYKGAVSWLIWGGSPAYKWLKSQEIRNIIENEYPQRKKSSAENNLVC